MVAHHRRYRRSPSAKEKAQKLVALVRRVDAKIATSMDQRQPLSSDLAVATNEQREIAFAFAINSSSSSGKPRYTLVSKKTWKSQYDLLQEQREATKKTAQILKSCIAGMSSSNDHNQSTRRFGESFPTKENAAVPQNAGNANTAVNEESSTGTKELQLCWWRQLSLEEESRVEKFSKEQQQPGEVQDFGSSLRERRAKQTVAARLVQQTKHKPGKKELNVGPAKVGQNGRIIALSEKPANWVDSKISKHQLSNRPSTQVDMKALYRRAFQVRSGEIREARQRKVSAAKKIQEWWRMLQHNAIEPLSPLQREISMGSLLGKAITEGALKSPLGPRFHQSNAVAETEKRPLLPVVVGTVARLLILCTMLTIAAAFWADGIISVRKSALQVVRPP